MTAIIFPNSPIGAVHPTVIKTFNYLKSLPDGCNIWHFLMMRNEEMPDFLVLNTDNQAVLIKVSSATQKQFKSRLQMMLLGDKTNDIGSRETAALQAFHKKFEQSFTDKNHSPKAIKSVVLFPNIDTKQVKRSKPSNGKINLEWLGKEYLKPSKLEDWNNLFPAQALDDISYQRLRELFTPEAVVPKELSVRQPIDRNVKAGLDNFLLDYEQEKVLKHDLELPEAAASLSRNFQVSLVNGVAGSGKTLILLYRLRLLHKFYPNKEFLVLTHNRALIRDIQWKYYQLCGDLPDNIKWRTFYKWLGENRKVGPYLDAISRAAKESIVQNIRLDFFKDTSITDGMLTSEIDWINDQVDRSRKGYISADRKGRGFRLSQNQLDLMYTAYEKYLEVLRKRRNIDWGLVPHVYWKYAQDGRLDIPNYDVVLIDEAQFFAPIWFEIVRKMVKPQTGYLFMVADPTQGFLNRGISWKSMGMEVRGRTSKLQQSYRTTKEIMSLATVFYRQRVPSDASDEEILEPNMLHMSDGVIPDIIPLSTDQDEIGRVVNEIDQFISKFSIPKSHILVIHSAWSGAEILRKALNSRLGLNSAKDPSDNDPGNYIRVTNLDRGTGIESPIVFFVGMKQLMEKEQSLRISEEEREQLIIENTRKIYMAMTRAGHRLVITYVGELPNDIQWIFQNPQ